MYVSQITQSHSCTTFQAVNKFYAERMLRNKQLSGSICKQIQELSSEVKNNKISAQDGYDTLVYVKDLAGANDIKEWISAKELFAGML